LARLKRPKPSLVRQESFAKSDAQERLAADYGLWSGSYSRGELSSMRAQEAALLAGVADRLDSPEACIAHRAQGVTLLFAGDYLRAREHLERALALFEPGRYDEFAFRYGPDNGVTAMAYLAFALWPLGEIDRAVALIARMVARMASLAQVSTLGVGSMYAAQFALMGGDPTKGKEHSTKLTQLGRQHDYAQFRAFGEFFEGWAKIGSDLPLALSEMRRGAEELRAQKVLVFDALVKIALAKAEADAGQSDRAFRSSMKRWRQRSGWTIGHSRPNCIGRAANSCFDGVALM
jgi:hypothetical protein